MFKFTTQFLETEALLGIVFNSRYLLSTLDITIPGSQYEHMPEWNERIKEEICVRNSSIIQRTVESKKTLQMGL